MDARLTTKKNLNIIDKNCNAIYYAQGSSRIHNLESIATSALDNHGLVRGVPEITLSASTGVGGDGRATRARVNLGPRGTEVVDGTSTVVKLFSKSEKSNTKAHQHEEIER